LRDAAEAAGSAIADARIFISNNIDAESAALRGTI
jgi:hypothetical protein